MTAHPPVSATRLDWVDAAKGVAITLVVLFHAVIFLADVGLAGFWAKLSAPLDTFRMPLFFFTAGIFAQKILGRRLTDVFRGRSAKLFWLYLLWSAVWAVVFQFLPVYRSTDGQDVNPLLLWLRAFVLPNESLWFLYALGLYFLAAWALHHVPAWLQLTAAAVLSIVFGSAVVDWGNSPWEKTLTYFVFFLLAVHTGPRIRHAAPTVRWWQIIGAIVAYVALLAPAIRFGLLGVPGVRLFLGLAGVAAGVALSVALSRAKGTQWVIALGRNTLPIYVLHFYVVLGGVATVVALGVTGGPVSAVLVPLLTATAILMSLGVHRLTRNVPGMWDLPRRLQYRSAQAKPVADRS